MRPWQSVEDLSALGLTLDDVTTAAYWRTGARLFRGSDAVGHALLARGGGWALLGRVVLHPLVRPLAGVVYTRVAANRHRLPGGTAACRIDEHRLQ